MVDAVDEGAGHHYVTPTLRIRGLPLRLFLLLSALLAGLTGLIAGDSAVARAREPAAIAAMQPSAIEQVRDAAEARRLPAEQARLVEGRQSGFATDRAFLPQFHPVDERQIE